jgi:hypothetical protein
MPPNNQPPTPNGTAVEEKTPQEKKDTPTELEIKAEKPESQTNTGLPVGPSALERMAIAAIPYPNFRNFDRMRRPEDQVKSDELSKELRRTT